MKLAVGLHIATMKLYVFLRSLEDTERLGGFINYKQKYKIFLTTHRWMR